MKHIPVLLLLLTLTAGCSYGELFIRGHKITKDDVKSMNLGVTTRDEAFEMFGEPESVHRDEEGETLTFRYEETRYPHLFGLVEFKGDRKTIIDTTLELLVRDGVVVAYNLKNRQEVQKVRGRLPSIDRPRNHFFDTRNRDDGDEEPF